MYVVLFLPNFSLLSILNPLILLCRFLLYHTHTHQYNLLFVFFFIYYYLIKNMVKNLGSLVTQETPSIDHKLLFFLSFVF